MKSSLAIIAGLLAISNASPTPKEVDILIDIKVEDIDRIASQQNSHVSAFNHILSPRGPCLMVCWPESPQCPTGWDPTNMTPNNEDYPCWTCCKNLDDDALAAKSHKKAPKFVEAAPTKNIFAIPPNICFRICAPQAIPCPEDWSPYNFGNDDSPCWTCCRNEDDNSLVAKPNKKAQKFVEAAPTKNIFAIQPNICLKICLPESIKCPDNWSPYNFGNDDSPCWTCCLNESDDNDLITKQPKKTPKFVEAAPSQKVFGPGNICWKICWPEEPSRCPDGWTSSNKGNDDYPCWTCCLNEPDDDFVAEL